MQAAPTHGGRHQEFVRGGVLELRATNIVFLKSAHQTYIIEKQLGAYRYWCNNRHPGRMTSRLLPESAEVQLSIEDVYVL